MKSIDFPGAIMKIGEGQEQYHTIHALPCENDEGEIIAIYELTDEEIEQIVKTRRIIYSRLTFHNQVTCRHCNRITPTGFQPFRISTEPISIATKLVFEDKVEEVEALVGTEGVIIPGYSKTPDGKYIKDEVAQGQ